MKNMMPAGPNKKHGGSWGNPWTEQKTWGKDGYIWEKNKDFYGGLKKTSTYKELYNDLCM